jgi:hypothetical protein
VPPKLSLHYPLETTEVGCENRRVLLTLCLDKTRVELTRGFYQRLGLDFSSEQHGDRGLPHYAAIVPSLPVEIYPGIKGLPLEDRLFVGFEVDRPMSLMMELIEHFGGGQVEPPVPVTASGIATLRDPNGLLVRLFPKTQIG